MGKSWPTQDTRKARMKRPSGSPIPGAPPAPSAPPPYEMGRSSGVGQIRTWELDRTPDLVDLVSAARDAGHEVMLIERPMPDAVSVAAIGRAFDIVSAPGGVALEDAVGKTIDFESGGERILAASRLWRRMG